MNEINNDMEASTSLNREEYSLDKRQPIKLEGRINKKDSQEGYQ